MEKEHTHKEIELRSEEVQEVMNRVPAWILRSGITDSPVFRLLGTLRKPEDLVCLPSPPQQSHPDI